MRQKEIEQRVVWPKQNRLGSIPKIGAKEKQITLVWQPNQKKTSSGALDLT